MYLEEEEKQKDKGKEGDWDSEGNLWKPKAKQAPLLPLPPAHLFQEQNKGSRLRNLSFLRVTDFCHCNATNRFDGGYGSLSLVFP